MVATEWHLWFNLSECDKAVLLDASGLFGTAVETVVDMFREGERSWPPLGSIPLTGSRPLLNSLRSYQEQFLDGKAEGECGCPSSSSSEE